MTKTKKLNKTELWEKVQYRVAEVLQDNGHIKKGKHQELYDMLISNLEFMKPSHGGGVSTKVNEEGKVWCNYFEEYMPAAEFDQKLNKKGEEVYKPNSREGDKILRKIKATANKLGKQLITGLRDGTRKETDVRLYEELEKGLRDNKYSTADEVPTVAQLLELPGA